MYVAVYETLRHPFKSLKMWASGSLTSLRGSAADHFGIICNLCVLLFYEVRDIRASDRAFDLLSERIQHTVRVVDITVGHLSGLINGAGVESDWAGATPLLYSLSSQLLHRVSAYAIMAIFVILLLLSVLIFIRKSAEEPVSGSDQVSDWLVSHTILVGFPSR
ncbi:hypothetical protein ACODNH_00885 (plasmid) [Haloarcula sp. NS06]|uniref:hypothetical protein n=1 Tax=Haloarcula sp. NS06 TaxID=3409688 RepID=UPI003DA6E44B